jgi:hypothetical protein
MLSSRATGQACTGVAVGTGVGAGVQIEARVGQGVGLGVGFALVEGSGLVSVACAIPAGADVGTADAPADELAVGLAVAPERSPGPRMTAATRTAIAPMPAARAGRWRNAFLPSSSRIV